MYAASTNTGRVIHIHREREREKEGENKAGKKGNVEAFFVESFSDVSVFVFVHMKKSVDPPTGSRPDFVERLSAPLSVHFLSVPSYSRPISLNCHS